MKYMLLLFNEEQGMETTPEAMAPWIKFGEDAKAIATESSSEALHPSSTATVVSVRDGKTITTDGPFIETKEQLGGFYIFDCKDLDAAIKLASMIPWAPTGHIEVRPVINLG
jgi:hypothetical protein